MMDGEGRVRPVIEGVKPEIDGGRFPIKRVVGESVAVEADIFADGHDSLAAVLCFRRAPAGNGAAAPPWTEVPMKLLVNDRWQGSFQVAALGQYRYTLRAWVDRFGTWRQALAKKAEAGQDVSLELLAGAQLVAEAALRADHRANPGRGRLRPAAEAGAQDAGRILRGWSDALASNLEPMTSRVELALGEDLAALMARFPDRQFAIEYPKELAVQVDRERARFSTWYELFPRSWARQGDRHGTFRDCEARLPYVAGMGFDVLYLPPIHPIARSFRKGPDNAATARPGDPGSPWAIGAAEGGHKAVHPELGTLEDFRNLVAAAHRCGMEVALDLAFQCSPEHPYVTEHPEWFRRRPDGTVQYAENPPKKYEDIYPINFETEDWQSLWEELRSVVMFWIEQGVRTFRVDNPHTKSFAFWEWLIARVKAEYPEVIFLAEAFTRPKVMYRLAKLGFTQSYTYFAWRNTVGELTQYLTELTCTDVREFFRPNLWPNTPDILTEYLQVGGRPAFMARLVLAATLGASYGIYGPAFELGENRAREPGSEEYLDSEKYQLRCWDLNRPDSLRELIATVNRIRRENPALHSDGSLRFHATDNEQLLCYSKNTEDWSNHILVVVNLDPHHTQSGWVSLSLAELGLGPQETFQVHDLLTGAHYLWQGFRNYVELNPHSIPAHIFTIRRLVRTERDFDYYS